RIGLYVRRRASERLDAPHHRATHRTGDQCEVRLGHPGALKRTARVPRGSAHGIRLRVDAVFSMRTFYLVLALLDVALVGPALTGGAIVAAQAVERTDVPPRGILRVTFDPRIMTWNDEFTDAGRRPLGFGLTGDTVGSRYIPALAQLEQDVRAVTGNLVPVIRPQVLGSPDRQPLLPRFVASLGPG